MAEQNDELEVLRRTNSELVAKNTTRKAKISELEAANAELTAKLSEATASLRAVTIDGPLKSMAQSISTAPELWIEQFSKSIRLEMLKGQLTMVSPDGKPVTKAEKAVPFERQALIDLLTTGDDAQARSFKAITIVSRASGAANTKPGNASTKAPEPPALQFGLR